MSISLTDAIVKDQDAGRAARAARRAAARQKVIMCHGVFDVVHPGHVRHMLYARARRTCWSAR